MPNPAALLIPSLRSRSPGRPSRRPFALSLEVLEDRTVPANLQAVSGPWLVEVEPSTSTGMRTWQVDPTPTGSGDELDHMYQEWFWYRVGESGPERALNTLTGNAATADGNQINLAYGAGADPIGVTVAYRLSSLGTEFSQIDETVRLTNRGSDTIDLHWFMYTDLDLDSTVSDDRATIVNTASFTQRSSQGNITVADVFVANGALPTHYQMSPYSTLRGLLEDGIPTTLNDSPSTIGPNDATHAMQWDILQLASGRSVEIHIIKRVQAQVILPTEALPNGSYRFVVPVAPVNPRPFDPVVAVGYDYQVSAGPNFASVTLPLGLTDNEYTLFVDTDPNTAGIQPGTGVPVTGGVQFDFPGAGVAAFRVTGIEAAANVNPNDQAGFVSNLSFVAAAQVDFTMTPLQANALDFGDAPDSYSTLLASDGPRHEPIGPMLGNSRDQETDGDTFPPGFGDNLDSSNDEDGVVFSFLGQGQAATATVQVSGVPGMLNAWIDFNGNGAFEANEQITPLAGLPVVVGPNVVGFTVPANAVLGTTFARFRVSTAGGLAQTGFAADGEVEDHLIGISSPSSSSHSPVAAPVSQPSLPPAVFGTLISKKIGRLRKQFIRLSNANGLTLERLVPFLAPLFRSILVTAIDTNDDGVTDAVRVSARTSKGKPVSVTFTL